MLVPHSDFTEVVQPMEVAQAETASTVENQLVEDPLSLRVTWTIKNFSRLNTKKHYSETFFGHKWRLLISPKGIKADYLSLYLEVADLANLPYGWSRYAQFSLAVVNQIPNKYTIRKDLWHQFNARESGWGFPSFMPLSELYNPGRGYLVNDTCIVEAKVAVLMVVKDTEGVTEEPLIVNDEETMVVEAESEVDTIISAEGITEEPAITNDEEGTVAEIQNVDMETMDTEVPVPHSDSTPAVSTGTAPEASIMAPIAPPDVVRPSVRIKTEELDSIVNKYPISEAHKYPISEAHKSTWRDIVKKYGDITYKSNIKNSKMKALCIETICDIISVLKGTTAQGLKMTIINQCESDLEDMESIKMDVSWLKERLHMLKTILSQSRQFSVMGDSFKVKTERLAKLRESIAEDKSKIENAGKEIAKQEVLIMESQESLKAKEEEFKAVQHAVRSEHEEFVRLSTAAEKLLYYGTKGFTLDLL